MIRKLVGRDDTEFNRVEVSGDRETVKRLSENAPQHSQRQVDSREPYQTLSSIFSLSDLEGGVLCKYSGIER